MTSDDTTTCGRLCNAVPVGTFGTPTGSVGSTGYCFTNSTFCPGGTYTIRRNGYSGVNFDCPAGYAACNYGGCCTGVGPASSPGIFCISCSY